VIFPVNLKKKGSNRARDPTGWRGGKGGARCFFLSGEKKKRKRGKKGCAHHQKGGRKIIIFIWPNHKKGPNKMSREKTCWSGGKKTTITLEEEGTKILEGGLFEGGGLPLFRGCPQKRPKRVPITFPPADEKRKGNLLISLAKKKRKK